MPEWTRKTPWRQGQLLPMKTAEALNLVHPTFPEKTVVIIASHDCDLAQTPEKEPEIEVIVGRFIDQLNGNYTTAKNSRILHMQLEGKTALMAEFEAINKRSFDKKALAETMPITEIKFSETGYNIFSRWLAARYRRSAFPDEFERRLGDSKLAELIVKAVKPYGEFITCVLFDVDEGKQLDHSVSDDAYLLDITLLYSAETDNKKAQNAAVTTADSIKTAFAEKQLGNSTGKWNQIELRYCDAISEEAISYHQFCLLKPWRLDHISLGADPQQSVPSL